MSGSSEEMSAELAAKQNKKDLTCINCRKWHTKCDRKKPTCTLCIERNIPCLYAKGPKKRGPRGGKVPVLDDIKKMEQEIERYKQMTAFYEQKTQMMEQQYNQLYSQGLLAVEPRGIFKLSNSMLFHTLIDIYMWGGYPSYEIKPPFRTLEEFESSKIYTPQKALMYSILASASAYTGDVNLYKQLEQEAKASMGPLFDNSNCPDIAQSHFMIAEAQMSMGDCEKATFYVDIARKSTDNFVSKFSNKPQAQHLKRVSDFTYGCLLAWAGYIDEALQFINQFYYSSNNSSLSGEEPNYVYQLNILQLKITLEAAQYINANRSANLKQYSTWITLAEQGDVLLKQTEKFPDRMRKILQVYQEATKALIYYVGNQPQFMLECVRGVLNTAKEPICVCSYWSSAIVAVITGLCLIYDWQEELDLSLNILQQASYTHPTSALLYKGVQETMNKYGKAISYRDFVRSVKGFVDHTAPLFNKEMNEGSSIVEIMNSSSVSSPEMVDSNSQMSDPNPEVEQLDLSPDMVFHDSDADAFIEQIMNGTGPQFSEEVVNPFIFPEDDQSIEYSIL